MGNVSKEQSRPWGNFVGIANETEAREPLEKLVKGWVQVLSCTHILLVTAWPPSLGTELDTNSFQILWKFGVVHHL